MKAQKRDTKTEKNSFVTDFLKLDVNVTKFFVYFSTSLQNVRSRTES